MPLQRRPMTLLFCSGIDNAALWRDALRERDQAPGRPSARCRPTA